MKKILGTAMNAQLKSFVRMKAKSGRNEAKPRSPEEILAASFAPKLPGYRLT
jgi:hypothetical protein